MDETGVELPPQNTTEVTNSKPKEGLLGSLKRRIFGRPPIVQQTIPTTNVVNPTSAEENFNEWSKVAPHPADKVIREQNEAALGVNMKDEAKPSFLEPTSPDDSPLTLEQPGETPVEVPKISTIPVKEPVPVEEPIAA